MNSDNSEAQKSEVHESTDDASSSPASNAKQRADSPPQGQGRSQSNFLGKTVLPAQMDRDAHERHRTNVAGVGPAEADDEALTPPGQVTLKADFSDEKPLYPTAAAKQKQT